jgi:uncharacterized membrane protein
MTDLVTSFTALPNVHPALVHFPVALAFTALLLEFGSLALPRRSWLERCAATLYGLAAAGAIAAFFAGRQAADTLGAISVQAEVVLADHADLALWTTMILVAAAILRIGASIRASKQPGALSGALRVLALITLLGGSVLVGRTADLGGALVFRHGVAVSESQASAPQSTPTRAPNAMEESPEVRLSRGPNGAIDWRPTSGDTAALGSILSPVGGSDAVRAIPGDGEGLGLKVDGEVLLVLPGIFDDLVAEARIDLGGFEGTVGLAYHVESPDTAIFFTVSTDGEVRLVRRFQEKETTFDSSTMPGGQHVIELRTTAAGNHLKGFVDGEMAVHGHGASGEAGPVGLYLNGHGVVRILKVTVEPASEGGH